ncbi:hypothetical protein [Maribacter sp. ACAM166]|uniref:hypothetical protein n=1 Tax=Maribacter sp. ACAM166 TaxID=2508996 RepID=UPI0010FEA93C|nr:hypothetical protein [Maribacter sp. ACAM166]TLP75479.1 hypothetical protein ES765_15390 [Maribacter sp. ACAM166]
MKKSFIVTRLQFKTITELPGYWTEAKYLDLLELMDFDNPSGLDKAEIKDMCLMSLTDNAPDEAAKIVLTYVFGNKLNKGQIENISNEILEEKLWEEYADLSLHEDFFAVHQLLYAAFESKFPHPEAVSFQVCIKETAKNSLAIFDSYPEATLVRLLVGGLPDNNVIHRLFDDKIDSDTFPEAKDILWQLKLVKNELGELMADVISSHYWFKDLKYVDSFEAETHADDPPE